MTEEIFNWATDSYDPANFVAWDVGVTEKNFPVISREVQPFLQNKYRETVAACTIVWGARQWFHTMGLTFTDQKIIDIVNWISANEWYVIGQWRNTWTAMSALAKYFAKFYPQYPCYYVTMTLNSPLFPIILSRGYSIWFTYQGDKLRDQDRADWLLEWKKFKCDYWHRTCIINKSWSKYITVDDSFAIKQYGIEYFTDLVVGQGWVNIYPTFYVWVASPNAVAKTEQLKKFYKWKIWLESMIQETTSMILDTTDQDFKAKTIAYQAEITKKLTYIMNEIKSA